MKLPPLTLSDHEGNDYKLVFERTTVIALVRYYG